eukprot:5145566-Pyramimonas_sp.AAC.1
MACSGLHGQFSSSALFGKKSTLPLRTGGRGADTTTSSGYIPSPLNRLGQTTGIFPLPSIDWVIQREHSLSPPLIHSAWGPSSPCRRVSTTEWGLAGSSGASGEAVHSCRGLSEFVCALETCGRARTDESVTARPDDSFLTSSQEAQILLSRALRNPILDALSSTNSTDVQQGRGTIRFSKVLTYTRHTKAGETVVFHSRSVQYGSSRSMEAKQGEATYEPSGLMMNFPHILRRPPAVLRQGDVNASALRVHRCCV